MGKVEPGLTSIVTCSGNPDMEQGPSGYAQGVRLQRLALAKGRWEEWQRENVSGTEVGLFCPRSLLTATTSA